MINFIELIFKRRLYKNTLFFLGCFCFVLSISTSSVTAQIAASSCDPAYFESMAAKGWLEAQREVAQNQNLIAKPDSVLEYTCFDQFGNELAAHGTDMFSESTRWGTQLDGIAGVSHTQQLDEALDTVVGDTIALYLAGSFNHDFGGGRHSGINYTSNPISAGSYNCDRMNAVWEAAKCQSFASEPSDGFFALDWYEGNDPRQFPPGMNCPAAGGVAASRETAGLTATPPPWPEDAVASREGFFDPAACTTLAAIPTGLIVTRARQAPTTYNDAICTAPGCFHQPGVGCVRSN